MSNSWPASSKWSKLKNLVDILVRVCHTCHVSSKLAFVLCLPRLRNPNIDQLCRQKLAYYIPAAFKYLTMIIYCICDCTRNILASLSFWMLGLQHRTSSKKFLWPKNSEAKCGIPNFKSWPLPWEDLRRTSIHKRIQGERSRKATQNYLNCCFWIVIEHNQVLLHHWNHSGWTWSRSLKLHQQFPEIFWETHSIVWRHRSASLVSIAKVD